MADRFLPPTAPKRLNEAAQNIVDGIFDDPSNALRVPFTHWVGTSKPFLAFAQNYTSKIRKKVRMCRDVEELYNLYVELRTAYLLLREPKFVVAYEPHAMALGRSADYAVTFRTNAVFHVEVTRLRLSQPEQMLDKEVPALEATGEYEARRLVDVVCDKVNQLAPDTPNILWIWSESQVIPTLELGQILLELKRRVDQRDPDLFARYGYTKPGDFTRYYQRLSAIILFGLRPTVDPSVTSLWLNKDARYPLPLRVETILRALIVADISPILVRPAV